MDADAAGLWNLTTLSTNHTELPFRRNNYTDFPSKERSFDGGAETAESCFIRRDETNLTACRVNA